eukprot:GHVH01005378.1.p1 GENE.GHVH01005378.1~~GHVH01005378.1.p1  ORF type:complete len:292 (-),score=59.84 GHVH01005378.1:39-914(-)
METINRVGVNLKDTITETLNSSPSEIAEIVMEKTSEVRQRLPASDVVDRAMETTKSCGEALVETTQTVVDKIQPFRQATSKFLEDRMSESDIDTTKSTTGQKCSALVISTYSWFLMHLSAQLAVIEGQIGFSKDDGFLRYYALYFYLLSFAVYDQLMNYIPVDREAFENKAGSMKSQYVDPVIQYSSDAYRSVESTILATISDGSAVVSFRGDQAAKAVQKMVEDTVLAPYVEKGIESVKSQFPLGREDIEGAASETADTSPEPIDDEAEGRDEEIASNVHNDVSVGVLVE